MKVIKDNYIRHHSHVQFTYESFKCHIIYVHILSLRLFWWSHLGILFSSSLIFTGDIGWLQIYQWWVFFWQHFFVLCTFNKTWAPITKASVAGCGDSSLTQTPVLKRQPSMVSFNCCAVAEVSFIRLEISKGEGSAEAGPVVPWYPATKTEKTNVMTPRTE